MGTSLAPTGESYMVKEKMSIKASFDGQMREKEKILVETLVTPGDNDRERERRRYNQSAHVHGTRQNTHTHTRTQIYRASNMLVG